MLVTQGNLVTTGFDFPLFIFLLLLYSWDLCNVIYGCKNLLSLAYSQEVGDLNWFVNSFIVLALDRRRWEVFGRLPCSVLYISYTSMHQETDIDLLVSSSALHKTWYTPSAWNSFSCSKNNAKLFFLPGSERGLLILLMLIARMLMGANTVR